MSFLGTPTLRQLRQPEIEPATAVRLASQLDLAGTKASEVQQRAEAKDCVDIDALLGSGLSLSLSLALAAARATLAPAVMDHLRLAGRVIWFTAAPEALRDPVHLVAHGVFDRRSWACWNLMLDRPETPLPERFRGNVEATGTTRPSG